MILKALSTETASCFLHQGKIPNIMEYFLAAGKAVETILVMTDAEETPERMQNIIKKYIPDGQKQKQLSWNEATEKIGIPSGDDLQPAGYKIITCISYIFPGVCARRAGL